MQVNKLRSEKGDDTTNTTEIQSIIKDYAKTLCVNKLENLEEMNNFLDIYYLSKLNQEYIKDLNRPITSKDIELVVKRFQMRKSTSFTDEFC
jgi:hypothetical protein